MQRMKYKHDFPRGDVNRGLCRERRGAELRGLSGSAEQLCQEELSWRGMLGGITESVVQGVLYPTEVIFLVKFF